MTWLAVGVNYHDEAGNIWRVAAFTSALPDRTSHSLCTYSRNRDTHQIHRTRRSARMPENEGQDEFVVVVWIENYSGRTKKKVGLD